MTKRGEHVDYTFGPFRLVPRERLLLRDGRPVPLTPKAFDTLVVIVERSGRLVDKEELLDRVWPGSVVEEATIAQNIFAVRRALGTNDAARKYIETVPKRGYRFTAEVETVEPRDRVGRPASPQQNTLAVLPLRHLGSNGHSEDRDHIGVGFADAFITRLSNVRGLTVRPTASVIHHGGSNALDAGRLLHATAVLDGTIRNAGNGVRVTLQLLRVADGALLWAESFDGEMTDMFRLEDAISTKLASSVVPQLTGENPTPLAARGTNNRPAYGAYQRGRFYWNQFDPQLLPKSIEAFEEAIALDPQFARAYVGLADAYNWSSIFGILPTEACVTASKAASLRALELDPHLGDALTALGFVTAFYDWKWDEGELLLLRALEENRNDPLAYEWRAGILAGLGRLDEWRLSIKRAEELNPLSLRTKAMVAWHAYQLDLIEEAISVAEELVALDGNLPQAHMQLGNALEQAGRAEEAIAALERALQLHPGSGITLYPLCFALVKAGRRRDAEAIRAQLAQSSVQGHGAYFVAMANVALGDLDAAFQEFERALEARDPWMFWMGSDPKLRHLHGDARFDRLRERVVPRAIKA